MQAIKSDARVEALFGARIPILQAGMGGVAQPTLAAAVCESGAFGMLGLYRHTNAEIGMLLAETARRTGRRFGVNFVPFVLDVGQLSDRLEFLATGPFDPVITFFGLPDAEVLRRIPPAADYGVQAGTYAEIDAAFAMGAKFCVFQTAEAGGHHLGEHPRAFVLANTHRLRLDRQMVFLSGGISNSNEVREVMDHGFSGVLCGTVFAATVESAAHAIYKQAIVDAMPGDTVITDCFSVGWHTHRHRVIRNRTCSRQLDANVIGYTDYFGKKYPILRYSVAVPTQGTEGEIAEMALYCGTSCKDAGAIKTVRQLLSDLTT
ncbi:nitronate monooxygenase [Robbsia sp. Bb-Pol-6]|uniref:Nitronate monooxygenase n=1 Tax=Robbsia betulipollinis TaxID=2981849 RepID=A0ABT3ZSV4_9BURK|nr:nitronate monooxygenase [Robbsia betulipollinis]MCY0388968.1 nitronate monooxygenase [Robbsia betulipollinis]